MEHLNKRRLVYLVVCVAVLAFLTGCNGPRLDETETIVYRYLQAVSENDMATLQEIVDPDLLEDVISGMYFLVGLSAFVGGATYDYTELALDTTYNNGAYAIVHIKGKLRTRVFGTQMIQPFEDDVPLVRKGGRWYITLPR